MKFCQQCGGELSNNGVCSRCGTEYSLRDLEKFVPAAPAPVPVQEVSAYPGRTEKVGYSEQTEYLGMERTENFSAGPVMAEPAYYETPVSAPAPAPKKGKGALIAICCGALVLGLAAGGVLVWLAAKDKDTKEETQISEKKNPEPQNNEDEPIENNSGEAKKTGSTGSTGNTGNTGKTTKFNEADYDETGTCGDDLQWGFVEDTGELVIMGTGEMDDYKVEYTDDYDTYTTAPWGMLDISSVRMDGVTAIGEAAFASCEALTDIEWGNSVTTVKEYAFSYCTSLDVVDIPDGVTTIESNVFRMSSLTQIDLPESVSDIGLDAFFLCTELEEINTDKKNASYTSRDGILFNKDKSVLVCYPAGKTNKSYTVPNGVTVIGDNAFAACYDLEEVILCESVESLGEWSFAFCDAIREMTIPDSVKTIKFCAFSCCSGLTTVELGSGIELIEDSAFDLCSGLTEVYYNGDQTGWDKVTIEDGNDCLHNADIYGN